MKKEYDYLQHKPPHIPQTLDEELRHWRVGEDPTFSPSAAAAAEKTVKKDRSSFFKKALMVPVASVIAVTTVFTAASNLDPFSGVGLHFEPDPIELYAGISCEGVDRGVLYDAGFETPCSLRYESLTEGLMIQEERYFNHKEEENRPEFDSWEEEEAWMEEHMTTLWMFYPEKPLENAEVRVSCEELGFEQIVRLNAYQMQILFDESVEKELEERGRLHLEPGATLDLGAHLNYDLPLYSENDKTIRFHGSGSPSLSVDENGRLSAEGEGTAEVYAYCMGTERHFTVSVSSGGEDGSTEYTLNHGSLTEMFTYSSVPLDCALFDRNGEQINETLHYTSLSPELLRILDEEGVAVSEGETGEAKVQVSCSDPAVEFTITVRIISPEIQASVPTEMNIADFYRIDPHFLVLIGDYRSENVKFIYESSDPEVLSVSQDGALTAVTEGTAVITIRCTDPYAEESYEVHVRPFDVPPPHTHDYELRHDENSHWQVCRLCGEAMEKEAHYGGNATCISCAVCSVCGVEYGFTDPDNHTGQTEIRNAKDATEEEDGYTGDTYCLDCGALIRNGEVIPSSGHVHALEKVAGVEPTHYESGNIDYYICTKCKKLYEDENAATELSPEDVILDVVPHEYTTKFDDKEHWKECSCGSVIDRAAHETEYRYTEETHWLECACSYKSESAAHELVLLTDAETHRYECICGFVSGQDRHYGGTATCVSRAKCEVCGVEYGKVDPDNHAGKTEIRGAREATEDAEGYTGDTYCLDCGGKIFTGAVIPKTAHVHSMSYTSAKAATHDAAGNIAYYSCSSCGGYFTDREGTNQITREQTVVPMIAHTYVLKSDASGHWRECSCGSRIDSGAHTYGDWMTTENATCTESGTRERSCAVCSYRQSETVAATGHSYGAPTYTWSGVRSCTATCVCANDSSHTVTENGTVTNKVTKAAACTAAGTRTYTAAFTNALFKTQTKTASIDALGHSYGAPTYVWASDNGSCTATCVCANDSSHTVTESGTATSKVTKAATCTATGTRAYTAAFTNELFQTQTKTSTIAALGHNYGAPTYTWSGVRSCTATCVCANDSSHTVTENGTVTNKVTKAAACTAAGTRTYTAAFTNDLFKTQTKTSSIAALGHSYDTSTGVCARCSDKIVTVTDVAKSAELTPNNASAPIETMEGDDFILEAAFLKDVSDVSYSVDAPKTVVIRASGNRCSVIPASYGTAAVTLSFTYDGTAYALPFYISVKDSPWITLNRRELTLFLDVPDRSGEKRTFTQNTSLGATLVNPVNSGDKPTYKSSSTSVATISSAGTITAVSEGSATITVSYSYTSPRGNTRSISETATVTVKNVMIGNQGRPDSSMSYIKYTTGTTGAAASETTIFGMDGADFVDPPVSSSGISYDKATNTLTLNGVTDGSLRISGMGSLVVKVTGTNALTSIDAEGGGYSCELIFTGTGKLTLNAERAFTGLTMEDPMNNQWTDQCLVVANAVTLEIYGSGEDAAAYRASAVSIGCYEEMNCAIMCANEPWGGTPTRINQFTYSFYDESASETSLHVVISP